MKSKIYNKQRQLVGHIIDGEVQIYAIDLKIAMKDYEGEDLVEFLKERGFRIGT